VLLSFVEETRSLQHTPSVSSCFSAYGLSGKFCVPVSDLLQVLINIFMRKLIKHIVCWG